ncbi:hypothetical protein FACS1894200_12410 [Spirochaetia bacterium]|nr:hypothetical protein FACS1894200_12410 [Spirochaetia bacterium]
MTMTRMFRRFVCRLMLGVLVFGQLAIAAYACPALSGMPQSLPTMALNASAAAMPGDEAGAAMAVSPDMVATSDMAAMASCDQIDDNAANLCVEHCRFGQQSADHASTPTVPAASGSIRRTMSVVCASSSGLRHWGTRWRTSPN